MERALAEYDCFMRALKGLADEWGAQNRAAIDAGISDGYMSQIKKGKDRWKSNRMPLLPT
jgi:hypothetical protein